MIKSYNRKVVGRGALANGYRAIGDDPFCSAKARVPSGYLWLDSACFSLRHKGFGGSSLSVAKEAKNL